MPSTSDSPNAGDSMSTLDEPVRKALEAISLPRRWRAGQTLLWAGERTESAFVVITGRVRIRILNLAGDERIVGWIGPGRIGALAPLLAGSTAPWDIVADEATQAMHLHREPLEQLMLKDATVGLGIARLLSARVNHLLAAYVTQSYAPLGERILERLLHLSRGAPVQKKGAVMLRVTQADLAKAVDGSRYRVGLELKRLEQAGMLVLGRGKIEILDSSRTAASHPPRNRQQILRQLPPG